jgi:hypothetical protein
MTSYYSEPLVASGHQDGSVRIYSLRDEKSAAVYNIEKVFETQVTHV